MAIRLTNNKQVSLLHEFTPDRNLPKYNRATEEVSYQNSKMSAKGINIANVATSFLNAGGASFNKEESFFRWAAFFSPTAWLVRFDKWRFARRENKKERRRLDEDKAMYLLMSDENTAAVQKQAIESYDALVARYKDAGQVALAEKLALERGVKTMENALLAEGYGKFVSEEKLVEVVLKSKKGLALSFVRNFARPIPDAVLDKKVALDKVGVFDEWVILHFDPDGINNLPTAEELEEIKRKERDPILFGLIHGSTRLYYVADWIDEHCDLTLEEFVKLTDTEDVVSTTAGLK